MPLCIVSRERRDLLGYLAVALESTASGEMTIIVDRRSGDSSAGDLSATGWDGPERRRQPDIGAQLKTHGFAVVSQVSADAVAPSLDDTESGRSPRVYRRTVVLAVVALALLAGGLLLAATSPSGEKSAVRGVAELWTWLRKAGPMAPTAVRESQEPAPAVRQGRETSPGRGAGEVAPPTESPRATLPERAAGPADRAEPDGQDRSAGRSVAAQPPVGELRPRERTSAPDGRGDAPHSRDGAWLLGTWSGVQTGDDLEGDKTEVTFTRDGDEVRWTIRRSAWIRGASARQRASGLVTFSGGQRIHLDGQYDSATIGRVGRKVKYALRRSGNTLEGDGSSPGEAPVRMVLKRAP